MQTFDIKRKSMNYQGRELILETGRMARQANGAVFISYGETSILVTATVSKEAREGSDFFPLTVDFIEKMYASGKIPGGFFKREAKPSTDATLNARLIDRAIRPLFPEGFRNEVQVIVTVLSYDGKTDPANIGILGASVALGISDIPFNGPLAGVCVGLLEEGLVINPTSEQLLTTSLELDMAGTENSLVMLEAGAREIPESQLKEAIFFGHDAIRELIKFQNEFVADIAKPKMEVTLDLVPEKITARIEKEFSALIRKDANILGKQERNDAFDLRQKEMLERYLQEDGEELFASNERYYKLAFGNLIKKSVRSAILDKHHRVDGRSLDDIRQITCEIDIVPFIHGSALFTRGETQSLGTVTLGSGRDEQVVDGLEEEFKKNYFLHYNFPPFSVGEVGFMRGPGRRELGHGALAERALAPVIPGKDDFPYTIRLVSEILESNGSSSMASVCSCTLAMMAAGVPIRKPVAGIANGLILEGNQFVVLTDIMGLEDHLGDMDFKVTGTRDGITAVQMDIKVEGISNEIMEIALDKARTARLKILDIMQETIAEPRKELSENAPRIEIVTIDPGKIGEVIGPGGKMIKSIIEETKAEIDIEDSGRVTISSPNSESIRKAIQKIRDITSDPEIGQIYEGIVSRIEPYGCFAKIMSNTKEGLVHISEMHTSRINRVEDMVKMGDRIKAKVIGLDDGKVKLSMKGVEGNPEPVKSAPGEQPPDNRRRYDSSRPPRRDYSSRSRDNSSQRRERSYRPDRNKDE